MEKLVHLKANYNSNVISDHKIYVTNINQITNIHV